MPDLTTLDAAVLDDDGYPTDEAISLIKTWTGTPRTLVDDLIEPIFGAYGSVRVEPDRDDFDRAVVRVILVTGGWSGCEEVIGALPHSCFGFAWWRSDERGGRHVYEVPLDAWEKPMPEWPEMPSPYARGFNRAAEVTRAELDEIRDVEGLPAAALEIIERLEAFLIEGPVD